jgi:DNA-binding transcriptional LysR family regulator
MMLETFSLDQLRILVAVVDAGSFSAAARRLKRAQSAISYAISSLEETLGVSLFDRTHWRPHLTEAGAALTAEARAVLLKTEGIRARAKTLREGLEAEVPIVVEVMFSMRRIMDLVEAFERQFPTVALNVHVESLGGAPESVLSGACRLGIVSSLSGVPPGLSSRPCESVPIEVVAAARHPLATQRGPITESALDEHLQIVLADRNSRMDTSSFVIVSKRQLRTADIGWKHSLLRAGMGWGFMPKELVEEDIASGRLRVLTLENRPPRSLNMPVSLVHRQGDILGPAACWIIRWLTSDDGQTVKSVAPAKPATSANVRTLKKPKVKPRTSK